MTYGLIFGKSNKPVYLTYFLIQSSSVLKFPETSTRVIFFATVVTVVAV